MPQQTLPAVVQSLSTEQSSRPFEGVVQYLSLSERSTRSQAWPLVESHFASLVQVIGHWAAGLQALPA